MSHVYAQAEIATSGNIATLEGLEGIFQNIISSLLFVAGIALFLMLLSGGIKFITSGGDPKKLESARSTLTFAIIGIILVAASYLVLVLIGTITGNTDILNFRIRI